MARVAKAPDAGETVTGSTFAIFGGGKGANQAIAAARSGAQRPCWARSATTILVASAAPISTPKGSTPSPSPQYDSRVRVALIVVEEETGQNRISYVPGATMTLAPSKPVRPSIALSPKWC